MALARLTDTDLTITPFTPQFTAIASDTLGNFGENTDGFDLIMSVPTSAFSDDVDSIGLLDQHLLDMDFNEGEFAGNVWTPVGVSMAPFTDAGDNLLSAFGDAVTPPDTNGGNPPPTHNPPPGGGGGGGDGGGVGGGPGTGGSGGPGIKCTVVSNPVTHEYVGVECEPSGVTGQGIHGRLEV